MKICVLNEHRFRTNPLLLLCGGVACVVLCFFSACGNARFQDFTETKNGLLYKLQDVGEGERRATFGDYITAQIRIKLEDDSVIVDTKAIGVDGAITFILPTIKYLKDYREGYLFLSEGDSASFITDAYTFFIKKNHSLIPKGLQLASIVRVETKVLKIRTPQDYFKETKEKNKKMERGEFYEKGALEKYIADIGVKDQAFANGMYYIKLREGNGITTDSARVALLNYKGFFLNGRCFDSGFDSQPFEYFFGVEDQLIPGLVIGLRKMHEGEKAKFIIPSHLAFGGSGSASEIVPPFTTVIYEVELIKVQ
jgi:FKBP-type peptidyl-prolyl cis-trans isomerase FkpA